MMMNDAGFALVKAFEGLRLEAYKCPAGVWTIGYGHTGPDVVEGMHITEDMADKFLRNDIAYFEEAASRMIRVPINENQFSAIVSLMFNVGEAALENSNTIKILNKGDYANVADRFLLWDKAKVNGKMKRLPGLTRRREAERELFLTPMSDEVSMWPY